MNAPEMQALIFDGPNRLRLAQVPRPVPAPGELLVRVHHATICGTDIRIVEGRKTRDIRYGYPIGHECSGIVEAVGAGVTGYVAGERVAVCVVVSCGECAECRADRENLCDQRITLGYHTAGAFAEFMLIPAHAVARGNVFKLPQHVPLEVAPLLEPMGCCINGQHEMGLPALLDKEGRHSLLILGAGPIGLLHLAIARAHAGRSLQVTMVEPLEHRRRFALQMGADEAVSPDEFNHWERYEAVIIAVGELCLVDVAMRAADKCGRVSLFAGFDKDARVSFDPNLVHYKQLILTGGSESRRRDYAEALELVGSGRVRLNAFVTHHVGLHEHAEAFRLASERVGLKVSFDLRES